MLCRSSHLNEILWNFSRFKDKERRLTLKQNPHFYEALPKSPEHYGDKFLTEPIETFLHKKISVLTDNLGQAGRVFLNIAKKTRAFGNVWVPKNAIIFKGSWSFFFNPIFRLLTSSQTSVESLRERASLVQLSKTHPTYGVSRNLRRRTPLDRRLHRIGVAHRRPRLRHRRLLQRGYY